MTVTDTIPYSEAKRAARKAAREAAEAFAEAPPPEDCPVRAVGHRAGVYFFLTPQGELRSITAGEMNDLRILSLFGGVKAWLVEAFPVFDRDGEVKAGAWSPKAAAGHLMRECTAAGIFDCPPFET